MNKMTKIILSALMVFTMTIANAQNKKEQIENLTFSLDSLNQVVAGERQNFNTTLDSLNQLLSKNQQDFELEMDKSSVTINNLNNQLIRLNSINDSINIQLKTKGQKIDSLTLRIQNLLADINSLSNPKIDKAELSVDGRLSKDTIAELLNQLKNIPPGDNYIVIGELKTDILKFKSVAFGDIMHFGFVDKKNKEYDFWGNITEIQLETDSTNPEDEYGYEANEKYVNKNFRVVWRTLKMKNKPRDEIDWYYEEYDQIIYLKEIN